MRKAIWANWEHFVKGFVIRITSPVMIGFAAILWLLGGPECAVGFMTFIGVLGGLRVVRQKTIKSL